MKNKTTKFTIDKNSTLFEFLLYSCKNKSRNNIKSMLTRGQVTVNGAKSTKHNILLKPGQIVEIQTSTKNNFKLPFSIIYEDEYFIVIDKPAGMLSISTDKEKEKTAYHLLTQYMRGRERQSRIFIIHRLDRETSGVLLFVKNEKLKHALQDNWAQLAVHRGYLAVVEGKVNTESGTVKSWLKETKTLLVYSSQKDGDGKEAITHYKTLKAGEKYSLLDIKLETGRKNQIRVHMKDIGYPVAGDMKYGAKTNPLGRLGLHANLLIIKHPFTGEEMKFESSVTEKFIVLTKF